MRNTLVTHTLAILLLAVVNVSTAEKPKMQREADHAALRMLMADVTEAINDLDPDKLATCFTKDFVFTSVDQTVLTSVAEIKEYYGRMLKRNDSPIKQFIIKPKADILTRFIDENTGCCYGTSEDEYVLRRNDRKVTMPSRWTAIVVKEDGQWKITAAHSGVNVLENPVLEAKGMSLWRKMMLGIGLGKYPGEK